jgi:hypothetical protein
MHSGWNPVINSDKINDNPRIFLNVLLSNVLSKIKKTSGAKA